MNTHKQVITDIIKYISGNAVSWDCVAEQSWASVFGA